MQVGDLIQKQSAAVGRFQQTTLPIHPRPGERPFFVAKQLTFDDFRAKGSTVESDEGVSRPGTFRMDQPGEQFLSHPTFSLEQDPGISALGTLDG